MKKGLGFTMGRLLNDMERVKNISVILCLLIILLSVSNIECGDRTASSSELEKAGTRLQVRFHDLTTNDETISIWVKLEEQYDTDVLYQEVRYLPKAKRRQHSVNSLKDFSKVTQHDLRIVLEELETEGKVSDLRYLWVTNLIGMRANREAIRILDKHPDVSLIEYDPLQYVLIGERTRKDVVNRTSGGLKQRNPADNIAHINVPEVWEQGYRGQGIIVAVLDTGVNYNHNDIRNQMWTHDDYPNHGYSMVHNNHHTMDENRHGTHCAGTVAGNGTSGTITGVAPEAVIMAVKVLDSAGRGQEQWVWEGVQFAVEQGADILSVSLGWINATNPVKSEFRRVMTNALNAGVIAAVAAGNEGAGGIRTPPDCPPPWLHPDQRLVGGLSSVVTVGATDLNDEIATFSSHGPATWMFVDPYNDYPLNPGQGLIKPDICAPGVDVLSLTHDNNSGYRLMNGTSMAAPAIAGVMALMLSKNPIMIPEDISCIIEETAIPLSETKSNVFGSGLVDPVSALGKSAYFELRNITYSENDNYVPEYGETVSISLDIYNFGIPEAEDIIGILATEDDYVNILQNRAEFGDLEIDSTITVNNAFTVRIADNIPDRHMIVLNLNLTLADERSWEVAFSMPVRAPYLRTSRPFVDDRPPGGNDNGIVDPGESLMIVIPLANEGGAMSPPVSIDVTTAHPAVEITDIPRTDFSSIGAGETIYPRFSATISDDVDDEEILTFSYSYQSGEYLFEDRFSVVVGGIIPIQLGAGENVSSNSEPSPINIFFRSLRTQTIYRAEELNDAGIDNALPITRLGYYVINSPAYSLPNFQVRMKHTSATDLTEHIEGPYQTVYQTQSYSPTAGDWDLITLQRPFIWNGRDNILVDTAFSPTQRFSATGQLRIYESEHGFRYSGSDNVDQTNERTYTLADNKPQIMIMFGTETGEFNRPHSLNAVLDETRVQLTWQEPEEERSREPLYNNRRTRNRFSRDKTSITYRNPDGYNIYRNGVLINTDAVEGTEFFDEDVVFSREYYYYVTALYGDYESSASNIADVLVRTATPQFSPADSIHYKPFALTMSCNSPNAVIYYTLDGSEPDEESYLYETPIEIYYHIRIKARAFKEALASETAKKDYYILYAPRKLVGKEDVDSVTLTWKPPWQPEDQELTCRQSKIHDLWTETAPSLRGGNSSVSAKTTRQSVAQSSGRTCPCLVEESLTSLKREARTFPITARQSVVSTLCLPTATSTKPSANISCQQLCGQNNNSQVSVLSYLTYYVYRSDNNADFVKITAEPLQDTIYVDTELLQGDYHYYVTALYEQGESLPSATVKASITHSNMDEQYQPVYITELLNAYPNPFNPETTIEFTLQETCFVSLDIFNIRGERVITLVNKTLEKGRHRLVWHGNNWEGEKVSSGIYLYRMKTKDYQNVRKMILLK